MIKNSDELDSFSDKEIEWLEQWDINLPFNLFNQAFTHSSCKTLDPSIDTYERIEFVGDAVLDLITADILFRNKEINEGKMTLERKNLVNNKKLSEIFNKLGLETLVRTYSNFVLSQKIRADFIESLFGALFIHNGYEFCRNFWIKLHEKLQIDDFHIYNIREKTDDNVGLIIDKIDPIKKRVKDALQSNYEEIGLITKNPVSILQELCQANSMPIPVYTEILKRGPDHEPIFEIIVTAEPFKDKIYEGTGKALTKKQAKLAAAANLCDKIYLPYILD
ncbi:MAG: ribonuclease III family protein [archaeon]|nr:ribonuclease III family protein [archaeon]